MMSDSLTYSLHRIRSYFTRYGIAARLWNADGTPASYRLRYYGTSRYAYQSDPMPFYGDDGRSVRAEAIAWCRSMGATRHV